ncbi:expressed unknown protein [Seminavis robusta]|uniref:Serine hydrolase domain-containing protein n=1 Tax=Seminavis robusta TaxID=568900 RepID=A0A9N8HHG9_9STRA|nr:expressed unknown protein [Seminavis robusta]|eukprot:Sro706_g190480.1 n/a (316) ;mRNA; f:39128-40289
MPIEFTHERSGGGRQDDAPSTGLRILCLHDEHSSASELKTHLTLLGDRLYQKHGIDLVYINSPLCTSQLGGETDRIWYDTTVKQELLGLDASLCLLQQIWTSMPFWGILAVGQGAAVGSLLSLLPDVKPRAKFGIFIQGEALIQEAEQLVDAGDDWDCLHIVDPNVKTESGGRLIQQFGGAAHQISRNGDDEGYSKKVLNLIGKFIIEQKKKIRQDGGECQALALQNQLHIVEQQASRLIAQQIAQNPPSVLMAVVAPKEVAAGGMKRRAPGEEGGGAPCPPEFLLRRDTRAQFDSNGTSSRVHPEDRSVQQEES